MSTGQLHQKMIIHANQELNGAALNAVKPLVVRWHLLVFNFLAQF